MKHFQLQAIKPISNLDDSAVSSIRQLLFNQNNIPGGTIQSIKPERTPTVLEIPPWRREGIYTALEIPGSLTKSDSSSEGGINGAH